MALTWRPTRHGDEERTEIRCRSETRPPFRAAWNDWTTLARRAWFHLLEQLKNLLAE
jgi:hypothetical protein